MLSFIPIAFNMASILFMNFCLRRSGHSPFCSHIAMISSLFMRYHSISSSKEVIGFSPKPSLLSLSLLQPCNVFSSYRLDFLVISMLLPYSLLNSPLFLPLFLYLERVVLSYHHLQQPATFLVIRCHEAFSVQGLQREQFSFQ